MRIQNTDTLDPIPNEDVTDNRDNKAVKTALKLINENFTYKSEKDKKNESVKDMLEAGFDPQEADGPRKINSKKLQQAYWKTASRMKPLDVALHGAQRPPHMEKLVTDGVGTVMRKGGFIQSLRDKGGAFQNKLAYGDGFVLFGTNEQSRGFPFRFIPISNNNLYVDEKATTFRSGSKPVNKAAVITTYTWGEFVALYPKMKKKAGVGRIPRNYHTQKDTDQKWLQATEQDDIVEVCFFYDKANRHYVAFAGSNCTVIEEKKGKDYPYVFKDKFSKVEEVYIPILHFLCMESFEGFYNHGILEMIYDMALEYQRLLNMALSHAEDVTYPYTMFSVPQDKASEVFNQLEKAGEARKKGKKPIIAIEQSSTSPNQVGMQSLVTQNLLNEAQVMWDMLDRECKRLGIHLDELEAANATATQILSDEENANAFVKQMMEKNASEYEFLYKVVLDQIPKVISKKDKTPLEITTMLTIPRADIKDEQTRKKMEMAGKDSMTIAIGGTEKKPEGVTLGDLASELSEYHYFVKVNARSGADMSKMQKAQTLNMLNQAAPGSQARTKLTTMLSQFNDIDIPGEEYGMPQQAMPTEGQEAPASTERQAINVRAIEPTAIF